MNEREKQANERDPKINRKFIFIGFQLNTGATSAWALLSLLPIERNEIYFVTVNYGVASFSYIFSLSCLFHYRRRQQQQQPTKNLSRGDIFHSLWFSISLSFNIYIYYPPQYIFNHALLSIISISSIPILNDYDEATRWSVNASNLSRIASWAFMHSSNTNLRH